MTRPKSMTSGTADAKLAVAKSNDDDLISYTI